MGEKIRSMIERDIAVVLLLLIGGLAVSGRNGRGFPFSWLYNGSTDTAAFLTDLAVIAGIVVTLDIVTMIAKGVLRSGDLARSREIRKAYRENKLSLPKTGVVQSTDAARNTDTWSSEEAEEPAVSIRTADAAESQGPGSREQEFLDRMREANKAFEERIRLSGQGRKGVLQGSLQSGRQSGRQAGKAQTGTAKTGTAKTGTAVLVMAISIIAASMIIISTVFIGLSDFDSGMSDWYGDGDSWIEEGTERVDIVDSFCEDAYEALAVGSFNWVDEIGTNGDAQAIIDMTEWPEPDLEDAEQYNVVAEGDPDFLVRRYLIRTDDGDFWLSFEFKEDVSGAYSYRANDIAFAGMAACPVPDWYSDEDYNTGDDEYDEKVYDYVMSNQAYIGDEDADKLILPELL